MDGLRVGLNVELRNWIFNRFIEPSDDEHQLSRVGQSICIPTDRAKLYSRYFVNLDWFHVATCATRQARRQK